MAVRRLEPLLVDRIAAGEVVERPASVVKELVENAIDAGAASVEVTVEQGGRSLIRVVDDGHGMPREDLELCVERHATSKLPDGDLLAIGTLGFRGEALPSIGSVALLRIVTRTEGAGHALELTVDCGVKGVPRPSAGTRGTRVEVHGLFGGTPARLKFLRTDRAEAAAVADAVRRIAMAYPLVRFKLSGDHISGLDLPAEREGPDAALARVARLLDPDFPANAVPVSGARGDVAIDGHVSVPAFNRGNANHVYFTVNGRPVRDKLLLGAIRGAYHDTLPSDRHPYVHLSLTCELGAVDVNCSPAKTDVRFREPEAVKSLVVSAIREALKAVPARPAPVSAMATAAMRAPATAWVPPRGPATWPAPGPAMPGAGPGTAPGPGREYGLLDGLDAVPSAQTVEPSAGPDPSAYPLGAAMAQLHDCYIVAQTADGMVVVDQHAAHERLVYERLKRQRDEAGVARQALLIPVVVEVDDGEAALLTDAAGMLAGLGLVVEAFGKGCVLVREVPSCLARSSPERLLRDVVDSLSEGGRNALEERLDRVLSSMACHGSVRSGRRMRVDEMNALLREIESTPMSGTCNHGRPVSKYISRLELEKMFERH